MPRSQVDRFAEAITSLGPDVLLLRKFRGIEHLGRLFHFEVDLVSGIASSTVRAPFDFISRLMEHEGIYYYFRHSADNHELVLCDSPSAHQPYPEHELFAYNPGAGEADHLDQITHWALRRQVQSGVVSLTDFDFKVPRKDLLTRRQAVRDHAVAFMERYDFPGQFESHDEGDRVVRVRHEELDAQFETADGQTFARGMAPGHTFTLTQAPHPGQNGEYLLTTTRYSIASDDFETADGRPDEPSCWCGFQAIRANCQFRPARRTAKPVVRGVQTAIVTGPAGQEIYTDRYGRVKVHFHWDRYGKPDQNASCWMRVSMPWAGKGWGGVQIPRIGQEVIVDFLEGDPDRPIITGRVYNGGSMPPLSHAGRDGDIPQPKSMQEAAQMMSLRSNSLGGSGGHNEITMNDTGGAEGLFLKAQKDEVHTVGNDRKDTVTHDETQSIGNDQTINVGQNLKIIAGTSITLQCGASIIHMNQAGFITISGTVISIAAAVQLGAVAPIAEYTGAAICTLGGAGLTVLNGAYTHVRGSSLVKLNGGEISSVASGDHIIQGAPVKVN